MLSPSIHFRKFSFSSSFLFANAFPFADTQQNDTKLYQFELLLHKKLRIDRPHIRMSVDCRKCGMRKPEISLTVRLRWQFYAESTDARHTLMLLIFIWKIVVSMRLSVYIFAIDAMFVCVRVRFDNQHWHRCPTAGIVYFSVRINSALFKRARLSVDFACVIARHIIVCNWI